MKYLVFLMIIVACGMASALEKPKKMEKADVLEKPKSYDKAGAKKEIKDHRSEVFECVHELAPKDTSRLILQWEILETGKASSIEVIRSVNKKLDACVIKVLKTMNFPKAPKGNPVSIKYPFVFNRR